MKKARDHITAEELATFDRNVEAMLRHLDEAAHAVRDTPDAPPPRVVELEFTGNRGRPRKVLSEAFLTQAKSTNKTAIVEALRKAHGHGIVSARTMRRRALELGVAHPAPPPKHVRQDGVVYPERTPREGAVSQEQLIRAVRDGRQRFQNFGGQMMQGYLASIRVHATWEQVKQACLVVDSVPQALRNQ